MKDNYVRKALVTRVIDGDTIVCNVDLGYEMEHKKVTIRLLGIDTPERGQEGYEDAKNFLINKIEGKEIFIESYKFKQGGFARYLGVIYTVDGENLNESLLTEGLAVPYVR